MKMECDYLNGWIKNKKKTVTYTKKSHPNWWTPEILLGNAEEEEGDDDDDSFNDESDCHYDAFKICKGWSVVRGSGPLAG